MSEKLILIDEYNMTKKGSKASNDNRANQMNPNDKSSNDNRSNQMNPNHEKSKG